MYPVLDPDLVLRRLAWPEGPVAAVLDTDTYNEIDDQFALIHALLSPSRIDLQAVYAAPFHNARSTGPADGMRRSHAEIRRILALMGREALPALPGSERWLTRPGDSVASPARDDLIERARQCSDDAPLYVIAIGAITNVAAAVAAAPDIRSRIVVLWLAGQPLHRSLAHEFNLAGDGAASRTMLDSGLPLVLFPCQQVAGLIRTTVAELDRHLAGSGPVGGYLADIFRRYEGRDLTAAGASKEVWDLAPIAWLIDQDWVPSVLRPAPLLAEDWTWHHPPGRHSIRVAEFIDRDAVFADLFAKVAGAAAER